MDTFLSFVIAFSLSLSLLSGTVMVVSSLVIYYTQKRYGFAGFAMMALGIILINIMFLNKAEFKDFKLGVSVADTITSLNGKQIDNRAKIGRAHV